MAKGKLFPAVPTFVVHQIAGVGLRRASFETNDQRRPVRDYVVADQNDNLGVFGHDYSLAVLIFPEVTANAYARLSNGRTNCGFNRSDGLIKSGFVLAMLRRNAKQR